MKKSFILLAACLISGTTFAQQTNPLLQHETEITEIIKSMTLEEKVNMLHGKTMFSSAGIERLGIADMKYADGPFGIREELEDHSWTPLGWDTDRATFFPTGSALAATWCPGIAYEYGKGMAIEAKLRGKDMILGPAMNIQRLPVGGRTYEYLSEDPFLTGQLAIGYTKGAQDMNEAVCLKHFAVNSQENMRGFINANISERALREIYLTPFEMAVKEGNAWGVMAAYNKVWGTWCSENFNLQNNILRSEWGFRGMIISDWGGTHSTIGAALGGLEVEMPSNTYFGDALIEAVKNGDVPMDVIDAKVRNILRVRFTVNPVPDDVANKKVTSQPETQAIAYKVASKSIVLLKNEGLLPLSNKVKTIAVIGDNATRTMALGGVGAGVKTLYEVTPLEGLQKALKGKAKIRYARGYEPAPRARWGQKLPENAMEEYEKRMKDLKKEALKVAKGADVVLFIGGDNREVETEGSDRTTIELPFDQDDLIEDIAEVNPNIVVVMVAGAPVDLREVNPIAKSLVYSWFNGTEGGTALADVLTGKIAPSGKLPFTLPNKLEDSPAYALGVYPQQEQGGGDVFVNLVNRDRFAERKADADYSEGIFVGYRWYTTKNVKPMYPFGYGLSYVPFKYSNLAAKVEGENIEVTFDLANQGSMEADEVAQVYIARPESKVERPKYELKGFKRVTTKAGETNKVTISIPKQQLRHWNEFQHAWNVEEGKAVIYVGSSSADLPLKTEITL
ncbi:MAG: glycoside hydrolase family 3 C-terminal domain-containing protein [Bacteroidaceae bacterium]|nr:glycoside hydrolase family 3 C-terminal domain-containing protein [Bacteroidaceae bacterium]